MDRVPVGSGLIEVAYVDWARAAADMVQRFGPVFGSVCVTEGSRRLRSDTRPVVSVGVVVVVAVVGGVAGGVGVVDDVFAAVVVGDDGDAGL